MKKKKPSRHFFRILGLLFCVFIILFILIECGYYESELSRKSTLTQEKIKEFENDVKKGEIVDLDSYIVEERPDYSNSVTKAGNAISGTINSFMTEGLSAAADILKKLFW